MSELIRLLTERGLLEATTHKQLDEILEKPISLYAGFDPTADSLHIGHLVGIVMLHWFQKYGHTPVIILGGATARIGDPSGKSIERPLLDDETIIQNVKSIRKHFEKMLDFSGKLKEPILLNNDDWLSKFSMVDFLREVGKHMRVSVMLSKESVRSRLESEEGISYTEFSYQLLQAYDFYYLHKNKNVQMQIGGSDQWGNIVAGIELIKKLSGHSAYGITFPLLTRSDGKKFGKTEGGAVWLSSDKFSPYQFYQYLVNIPDADVIKMMRMLTFMKVEEISQMEAAMKKTDYLPNTAQKKLAEEVTRFVHGENGLQTALKVTSRAAPGSETVLSADVLEEIAGDMPTIDLKIEELVGQKISDIFVLAELVTSKGEAARLIKNGGAYMNNQKIMDASHLIGKNDVIDGRFVLLAVGKKKKILIQIASI